MPLFTNKAITFIPRNIVSGCFLKGWTKVLNLYNVNMEDSNWLSSPIEELNNLIYVYIEQNSYSIAHMSFNV